MDVRAHKIMRSTLGLGLDTNDRVVFCYRGKDSPTSYKMFKMKNREFTFTVDVSKLPCGLNGALYFVEMDSDGGMAKYPGNKVG